MASDNVPAFAYSVKAHPTTYSGVRFRSRLEATWAAFFDIVGWDWSYEPIDLIGWTPDFRITHSHGTMLVEVKPHDFTKEIGDKMSAAAPDTWLLFLPLEPVSLNLFGTGHLVWRVGREYSGGCWDSWLHAPYDGDIGAAWAKASNTTRWAGPRK